MLRTQSSASRQCDHPSPASCNKVSPPPENPKVSAHSTCAQGATHTARHATHCRVCSPCSPGCIDAGQCPTTASTAIIGAGFGSGAWCCGRAIATGLCHRRPSVRRASHRGHMRPRSAAGTRNVHPTHDWPCSAPQRPISRPGPAREYRAAPVHTALQALAPQFVDCQVV